MKKFCLSVVALFVVLSVSADDSKFRIAVFDPVAASNKSSVNEGVKTAVREIISTTIVNTGSYDIVERSLLEKVMQEQQFSNSGVVDDKDVTEIGKLAGANKIVLSILADMGGKQMLSIKMIDVKTATIDRQEVGMLADIFADVEQMTLKIVGAEKQAAADVGQSEQQIDKNSPNDPTPSEEEVVLFLPPYNGRQDVQILGGVDKAVKVFLDGDFIGSGTFAKGFTFVIDKKNLKTTKKGTHELKVGNLSMKADVEKYNYFRFETATKTGGILNNNNNMAHMPSDVNKTGGFIKSILGGNNNSAPQQIVYTLKIILSEQKHVTQ